MNETHTPGPWQADFDKVDNFSDVYAVGAGQNGASVHLTDVIGKNHRADARLISAAPEMLEALKRLERFSFEERWGAKGFDDEAERVRNAARAAIRKAEGES